MFFIISKIAYFLTTPIVWVLGLTISGLLIAHPRRRKILLFSGIGVLLFFSNPFIANEAFLLWETKAVNNGDIKEPYDAGIVLGGMIDYYNSEMGRPVFGHGMDRLLQAVNLYQEGKIRKIIITGGAPGLVENEVKEALVLKQFLISIHIPETDMLIESESRNTRENALYTAALLKQNGLDQSNRLLLITSAYHMRRSLACFRKAGLTLTPYSVDQQAGQRRFYPDRVLIPSTETLNEWNMLIHEWIGFICYFFAGYLA